MACTDITPVSGVKLYIAARSHLPTSVAYVAPNPETDQSAILAGWAAIPATSWLEVTQVSDLGARGIKRNTIEYAPLGSHARRKTAHLDYGTMAVIAADLPEDAGQLLMLQAAVNGTDYPFKIVHNDATTAKPVASVEYFPGTVAGWSMPAAGDADAVRQREGEIAINGYCYAARRAA